MVIGSDITASEAKEYILTKYGVPEWFVDEQSAFFWLTFNEQVSKLHLISDNAFTIMRQLYIQTRGSYNLDISQYCLLANKGNKKNMPQISISKMKPNKEREEKINSVAALMNGHYSVIPRYISLDQCDNLISSCEFPEFKKGASRRFAGVESLYEYLLVNFKSQLRFCEEVASIYLGCNTLLRDCSIAHSVSFNPNIHSITRDALQWHFDHENNRHLKFFIYLTDVSIDNGPHCYIPNTARNQLPSKVVSDGRYKTSTVLSGMNYPCAITGSAGTMLIGDTQNIHRGTPLKSGERYMLQLTYCDSLYGRKEELYTNKLLSEFNQREPFNGKERISLNESIDRRTAALQ